MKTRVLSWLIASVVRMLAATLRYRVTDDADAMNRSPTKTALWIFWHNRILGVTVPLRRHGRHSKGVVLTSASRDGELLAAVMRRFDLEAARGSSSRRGSAALMELRRWLDEGFHAVITPDGPRGPRYRLGQGVIFLAQKTGIPIVPVHVNYSSYWTLRSWDRFIIPKPFSRVDVRFAPLEFVKPTSTDEEFEAERLRIEKVLNDGRRDSL
jgi:lysophospholipid acyltransferase (LPLAT)-like uncharacterized protein